MRLGICRYRHVDHCIRINRQVKHRSVVAAVVSINPYTARVRRVGRARRCTARMVRAEVVRTASIVASLALLGRVFDARTVLGAAF